MKNSNKLGKLFALSILTLTLSSCGGSAGGGGVAGPTELKAVANGVANQVEISWAAVAGATGYTLYQTTDNLSGFTNADPANLAAANPAAGSSTFSGTVTSTIETLSGTVPHYFLITSTQGGVESLTSAAQIAATAHNFVFATVAGSTINSGGETFAATTWMDRNLGAQRVATASDDTLAHGDYYQWGRAADGHQIVANNALTGSLAASISPGHAQFVTNSTAPFDWTAAGVDDNGAARSEFWSRIDGSSICPTGFRVPTGAELSAEITVTAAEAFASNLKWATVGFRGLVNGTVAGAGSIDSYHWGSTVGNDDSRSQTLLIGGGVLDFSRAVGMPVRCIQN